MNKYVSTKTVTSCFNSCNFYSSDMDGMKCTHPFFNDNKDVYANMIITCLNSRDGKIPKKCPLRKEGIEVIIRFELSDEIK